MAVDSVENKPTLKVQDLEVKGDFVKDMNLVNTWLNGLTASNTYAKIMVKNGVLYMVVSTRLTNSTESDITTAMAPIAEAADLPDEIASKIYRKDGTNVSVNPVSGDNICGATLHISNSDSGGIALKECSLYSTTAKNVRFWSSSASKFTVPAGAAYDVDVRVFLIL